MSIALALLAGWICKGVEPPQGRAQLVVNDAWVNIAIWSKDGSRVVTFGEGGPRVWDPISGRMLYALNGNMYYPAGVRLSPDGSRVIAYGKYTGVPEWDLASGELIHTYGNVYLQISSAFYSKDGSKVFTTDEDGRLRVWDDRTGKLIEAVDGKRYQPLAGDFSTAGSWIPSQGLDERRIDVFDLRTGFLRYRIDNADELEDEPISPDGKLIVGVVRKKEDFQGDRWIPEPGRVQLSDAQTGKAIRTLNGSVDDVCAPQFSPDGRFVAASDISSIKIWDAASGLLLQDLGNRAWEAQEIRFAPDGKTLAAGMIDKSVVLWDVASGKLLHRMKGHTMSLLTVRFSPDGKRLLSASKDGSARIWDVRSGRLLQVLKGISFENLDGLLNDNENETAYKRVEYQPSGAVGAVHAHSKRPRAIYGGGYLQPWKNVKSLCPKVRGSHLIGARLSPDHKWMATRSDDGSVQVWEVRSGKLLHTLGVQTSDEEFAFFTRDGSRISTNDGTFRFWDLKTGKLLYRTLDFQDKSWLTISRDGRYDSSEGAHPRHGHFVVRTASGASAVPFEEVCGTRYFVPNLADRINRGTYTFHSSKQKTWQ